MLVSLCCSFSVEKYSISEEAYVLRDLAMKKMQARLSALSWTAPIYIWSIEGDKNTPLNPWSKDQRINTRSNTPWAKGPANYRKLAKRWRANKKLKLWYNGLVDKTPYWVEQKRMTEHLTVAEKRPNTIKANATTTNESGSGKVVS